MAANSLSVIITVKNIDNLLCLYTIFIFNLFPCTAMFETMLLVSNFSIKATEFIVNDAICSYYSEM